MSSSLDWSGLLCIDPNGLRETEPKGPIFFLLDTLNFTLGFNDKSGHFVATINDNKNAIYTTAPADKTQYAYMHSYGVYTTDWYDVQTDAWADGQAWLLDYPTYPNVWYTLRRKVPGDTPEGTYIEGRPYDMMLFTPDTPWIRDNDEYWIGVQQGNPWIPNDRSFYNTWTPETGGRKWLQGGWISRRYYTYGEDGRITAVIEGKDYMDLFRHIPINIHVAPSEDVSSAIVAEVNRLQHLNYRFTGNFTSTNPSYGMDIYGVDAFTAISSRGNWAIVPDPTGVTPKDRRVIETPSGSVDDVAFDENIRSITKLLIDDTTQMVTDWIHVSDFATFPANPDFWCIPTVWVDRNQASQKFHLLSVPPPSNPNTGDFTDMSLIRDEEGNPAICFKNWGNPVMAGNDSFYNILYFGPPEVWNVARNKYVDSIDKRDWAFEYLSPFLANLRPYDVLKFKFRHATRGAADSSSQYIVRLHTMWGYDEHDEWESWNYHAELDEWLDINAYCDFTSQITDDDWTEVTINLEGSTDPHFSWAGNFPTPVRVWGISFEVIPEETEPQAYTINGKHFMNRIATTAAAPAGSAFIKISNPENYFFRGDGFATPLTGEIVFDDPKPVVYIGDVTTYEEVTLDGINGDYPGTKNVRLTRPLVNSYSSGKHLYIPSGRAYCLSRIRFERTQKKTASIYDVNWDSEWLDNPKRYQVLDRRETITADELDDLQNNLEYSNTNWGHFKGVLDGDPTFLPGLRTDVLIDEPRKAAGILFSLLDDGPDYTRHYLRDVEYVVDGVDFYMIADIADRDIHEQTSESIDAETQRRDLQNKQRRNSLRFEVRE